MSYAFHRDVVLLQSPIWDCILSFTVLQLCIKLKYAGRQYYPSQKAIAGRQCYPPQRAFTIFLRTSFPASCRQSKSTASAVRPLQYADINRNINEERKKSCIYICMYVCLDLLGFSTGFHVSKPLPYTSLR